MMPPANDNFLLLARPRYLRPALWWAHQAVAALVVAGWVVGIVTVLL